LAYWAEVLIIVKPETVVGFTITSAFPIMTTNAAG
jgi:hypothetical protein